MLSVGLTGGIGSGKSTFAALLAERGAEIIDADAIGRAVLEPGEIAWRGVVDQFGHEILVPGTMEIARKQLAEIVFNDPTELAVLNAITHPRIVERIAQTFEMLSDTDEIVILDAALIVGTGFEQLVEVIIVVDASDEVRRRRLIAERGMLAADVDARMRSQVPREVLLSRADIVVTNDGGVEDLATAAAKVWDELAARRDAVIEIVFFDAGDTLLRPHPSFEELFASVCSTRGYEVAPEDVTRVRARMAPHLVDIAEATGVENPSLSAEASLTFWSFLYRRFLEELEVTDERLVKELFSVFSSSASYKLYPDVLPAVEELRASGYRLGLISNFETWLEDMLVELELGGVFEPVVISGREGIEKPDPALYRIAVERAAIDPARCVHVGDSPKMDVEPALEVGLKAVLLDRLDRYPDAPYPRIESLAELIPAIGRL